MMVLLVEILVEKPLHIKYYEQVIIVQLFSEAPTHIRGNAKIVKLFLEKKIKIPLPLLSVEVDGPFEQWDMDIIGEIDPNSSKLHNYIITTTKYFTMWTE